MYKIFYNIFLLLYAFGVRVSAIKSTKAKLWLAGRQNIFSNLQQWRNKLDYNQNIIWVHCASLGEFEQGRPIIEKLKIKYPQSKILLTFFSPSGYEIRKHYKMADAVFYLPLDGHNNATKFIEIVKPTLAIWVKYEYWFYYLTILKQRNINVILVSAIFRKTQPFFKWYGGLWQKILTCFEQIFVQDEASVHFLKTIGITNNVVLAGDTRFDRVIDIAEKKVALPIALINFCDGHNIIVAGSTWQEDEELLVHYAHTHKQIKFIVAPHETSEERLQEIETLFKNTVRYSDFIAGKVCEQIIIIDNVGMLSSLYKLATVAYIGGGFNDSGIHNILEAAVYGKPILFGTEYEKFKEATDLLDMEAVFSIDNALELETLFDKLLGDNIFYAKASISIKEYVYKKQGATNIILQHLERILD